MNFVEIWQQEQQYVSKTCLKFDSITINYDRATVSQIAIPLCSKIAILNLSRNWTCKSIIIKNVKHSYYLSGTDCSHSEQISSMQIPSIQLT